MLPSQFEICVNQHTGQVTASTTTPAACGWGQAYNASGVCTNGQLRGGLTLLAEMAAFAGPIIGAGALALHFGGGIPGALLTAAVFGFPLGIVAGLLTALWLEPSPSLP